MSEMNNRSTYDFAAALRGEELKEATELTPEPTRPSYDFAAMLRQAEEPALGRPMAEEATAGLRAAEATGPGTQVIHGGEVVIPPAREPEEEEVEERIQNRLVDWLKDVDWKNAAKQGALMLGPAIFSGVLWETMPQLHQALESFVGGGMIGGFLAEGLIGALSQAEKIHPRFAGLARVAAARRGTGFLIAQMAASAGIGIVGAEGLDRFFQAHAVQSTIVGGSGEGSVDPTISAPTHGSNVDSTGYYHGVSDVNLPQPSETVAGDFGGLQPPADVTSASEATQQAVQDAAQQAEAAAQAAAEQAAAAAAQQAEALRQTTLEAATRVVEVQPGDTLTGLVARAGGDAYGADFTNTVLQSVDVLTGPQNPHRDMARALVEFIKTNPGVNWRDAINGVGDLAKKTVGGVSLKDAIAQATRMIYPGQEMKIVVGAALP